MRTPRSLSSLLVILGALALLASPLSGSAAAASAKQAPTASKAAKNKAGKPDKARSEAAKKGWETRRINQKAEANWAARLKKNPAADKPGAKDAFLKRSVASQRSWQTRKANMASKGAPKKTTKKAVKKTGKKVAKAGNAKDKKAKTGKKAANGKKKGAAADDTTATEGPNEKELIENAGVGNELFTQGLGSFDEARAAKEDGREVDAAVAQMEGHDAMAESAFATADAYEAAGKTDEAAKLRDFGNGHLSRADAIELALGEMMPSERQPGPIKRFFSWLNPFKKRGGSGEQASLAGEQ